MEFPVAGLTVETFIRALGLSARFGFSLWDATIIAAAMAGQVTRGTGEWWLFCDTKRPLLRMTETLSIKVSKELKARLHAAAKSRHAKPSALVREALELVISGAAPKSKPSLYDHCFEMSETGFIPIHRR